jgi:hypothetical protein
VTDATDLGARSGDLPVYDHLYVAARCVLLDALTALSSQRDAVVVAGAQAVYLHAGPGDLAIAPYTTDGDLALDPGRLNASPELEDAMTAAGFALQVGNGGHAEPGVWVSVAHIGGREVLIPVDLIVPDGVAVGGGRRAARLGSHGRRVARRAVGLEAALVDNSVMTITALDPADSRALEAKVAGPAALFVAKAHKIHDRLKSDRVDRLDDKDAADVIRLMQTTRPAEVGETFRWLGNDPVANVPSAQALSYLERLFGRGGRPGVEMATRALRTAMPAERVAALCTSYVERLLISAVAPVKGT